MTGLYSIINPELLRDLVVLLAMWLVIVAILHSLAVEMGAKPRISIRVFYCLLAVSYSVYLVLGSSIHALFSGIGLWALAIVVLLLIAILIFTYEKEGSVQCAKRSLSE